MAVFGFFEKRSKTKNNRVEQRGLAQNQRSLIQKLTGELRENIRQDFQKNPEKGSDTDIFRNTVEQAIRKHVEGQTPPASEDGQPPKSLAVDALPLFHVSADRMKAYVCILPPLNEGNGIEQAQLLEDMRYEGIASGIDQEAVSRIVSMQNYLHIIQIACGKLPKDVEDGELEEMFERRHEQALELDENESLAELNFRKQNSVQFIQKGDVICRIKPPVMPEDGMDISGRALHGKGGEPIHIPQGKNTTLSEDGTILSAAINGTVIMDGDDFTVQDQKVISENVNAQMGDIEYNGDIFILGNIEDGVTVKATGNIIILGEIRKGRIISNGTIRVQGDIKGSGETQLKAARQIQCTILEDAEAVAKGNIYAEVIANSEVISEEGSVYALMGRGLIFGGDVKAHKSICAKKIGNISGCTNKLTMNYDPELDYKITEKKRDLENIQKSKEKLEKDISDVSMSRQMSKLMTQRKLCDEIESDTLKELKELENKIYSDQSNCISCEKIHPVTQIRIGVQELTIEKEEEGCNIHMSSGKVLLK